jgi:hypothetical protein
MRNGARNGGERRQDGEQHRGRQRRLIRLSPFACALLLLAAATGWPPGSTLVYGADPLAGNTFFRPAINVSHSKGESHLARTSPRSLSLDPRGSAYLFWSEAITHTKGVTPELVLARFMPAAGWDTTVTPIGRWEGDPSTEPASALDPDHLLHVVWLDQSDAQRAIWGLRFSLVTGEIVAKDVISDPAQRAADPAVAVDREGRAHVVWSELASGKSSLVHRVWSPETGWGPIGAVPSASGGGAFAPDVACNAAGALRVVWQESGTNMIAIGLATRAPDGTWDQPSLISDARPGWYATAPVIAVAPAADSATVLGGALSEVILWQENDGRTSRLKACEWQGTAWQPAVTIAEGDAGRRLEEPSAALGADRVLHLLWIQTRETDPVSEVHYLRWPGGPPDESRPLTVPGSGPYATPMIAADAGGRVMAVWMDLGEGAGDMITRTGVAGFGSPLGTGGY